MARVRYIQTWLCIDLGCITTCNIICAILAKHFSGCFSFQSNIEFRMCWSTRNQTWLTFIKSHFLVNYLSCKINRQKSQVFLTKSKEYIERRHGEPFKFLFLTKMGLLGSQTVHTRKKSPILNYEQLFSSVFLTFHGQNFFF